MKTQREVQFRNRIEGLIPDCCGIRGATDDPPMSEVRDSIHDLVSDKSVDYFPHMDDDERRAMVGRVVNHFCGPEAPAEVGHPDPCFHDGYITVGSQNYPYDSDRGPYCPVCDEAVEL